MSFINPNELSLPSIFDVNDCEDDSSCSPRKRAIDPIERPLEKRQTVGSDGNRSYVVMTPEDSNAFFNFDDLPPIFGDLLSHSTGNGAIDPVDHPGEKRQAVGTNGRTYVKIPVDNGPFYFNLLPDLVRVRICRMLDIPDALNLRAVMKKTRETATHPQVWQLNTSYIDFPMLCIPSPSSTRLKNLFEELQDIAKVVELQDIAKVRNLSLDLTRILEKETHTLQEIRELANALGRPIKESDFELVRSYVKELRKMAILVEDRPADITKLLNTEVLTIEQINHLQAWIKARAELILWSKMAKEFQLVDPVFDPSNSASMIAQAKDFKAWCVENKEALADDIDEFWLNDEKLFILPEEISYLKGAPIISVDGNYLSQLPTSLRDLSELITLCLSDNRFTEVPKVIADLKSLDSLQMQGNQLSSLPEWLSRMPELIILYLPDNQLSSIPDWFSQFKKLIKLQISNNKISSISPAVAHLKLETLCIDGNPLTELPEDFLLWLKDDNADVYNSELSPEGLLPWWNSIAQRIGCPIENALEPAEDIKRFLANLCGFFERIPKKHPVIEKLCEKLDVEAINTLQKCRKACIAITNWISIIITLKEQFPNVEVSGPGIAYLENDPTRLDIEAYTLEELAAKEAEFKGRWFKENFNTLCRLNLSDMKINGIPIDKIFDQ